MQHIEKYDIFKKSAGETQLYYIILYIIITVYHHAKFNCYCLFYIVVVIVIQATGLRIKIFMNNYIQMYTIKT